MNVLDRVFKRNILPPIPSPETKTSSIIGISNSSYYEGSLNYTKLSDNPDVRIAVDKIADLVSNMTIHLMENKGDGDKRVKNELSRKVDINPCSGMTRKTWLYKIVQDLLLYGDGNSLVHIGMDSKTLLIDDLTPLDMDSVEWKTDKDKIQVKYRNRIYELDELIHFAINPNPINPRFGQGYRVHLRDIVKNLSQASRTKNDFMRSTYMPSLIIKVDSLSDELSSDDGKEAIKNKWLRSSKANEPWVIPAELFEVEQIKPLSLKDIAINDTVNMDKTALAGLLQIPSFFLGVGEFNKEEYNNFIDSRIMGIAQIISQTLTRDLLFDKHMYFKLNPRSLYAYNLSDLVSSGGMMVQLNAMRRNELRDWVGMNPDPEMNDMIVLENYIPQEKLGDQGKLNK